jgi:hypothetical protein
MPIDRDNITHLVDQLLEAAERDHPNADIIDAVLVVRITEGDVGELRVRYGGGDPANAVSVLQSAIASYAAQRV